MEVINLSQQPNKSVITVLEDALEAAKDGKIADLCIAYVTSEGNISGDFSGGKNKFSMWAALSHCEREFYQMNICESE